MQQVVGDEHTVVGLDWIRRVEVDGFDYCTKLFEEVEQFRSRSTWNALGKLDNESERLGFQAALSESIDDLLGQSTLASESEVHKADVKVPRALVHVTPEAFVNQAKAVDNVGEMGDIVDVLDRRDIGERVV